MAKTTYIFEISNNSITIEESLKLTTTYEQVLKKYQREIAWLDDYIKRQPAGTIPATLDQTRKDLDNLLKKRQVSTKTVPGFIKVYLLRQDRADANALLAALRQISQSLANFESARNQDNKDAAARVAALHQGAQTLAAIPSTESKLYENIKYPLEVTPRNHVSVATEEIAPLVLSDFAVEYSVNWSAGISGGFAMVHPAKIRGSQGTNIPAMLAFKCPKISVGMDDQQNITLVHEPLERFRREIQRCQSFRHGNVIQILGTFERSVNGISLPIAVFPWAVNKSLREYLCNNPVAPRFRLLREAAAGLAYIHNLGALDGSSSPSFIHCDINANNMLISADGRCMVSDFGLTKPEGAATSAGMGSAGHTCWRAPELIATVDRPAISRDKKTDVYAFGIMIFEALSIPAIMWPYGNLTDPASIGMLVLGGFRPSPTNDYSSDGKYLKPVWDLARECWSEDRNARPDMRAIPSRIPLDPWEA